MSIPLSPNVALANNLEVLTASVELGAEAICRCLGSEEVSSQLDGVEQSPAEIQEALSARLAVKLGI